MITGATRVCAVIGDPIRHSLSPIIHNAAFAAMSLDIAYVAFPVSSGSGSQAVAAMRSLGLLGMSVTMPLKFEVAEAVDRLTPQATKLQSCNTVFRDPEDPDVLWGDSTDGDGFVSGLTLFQPENARVVVVGAGGAGRAVIEAVGRSPVAEISVLNRDPSKASAAAQLATVARVGVEADITGADLVINATSVGMRPEDKMPFDIELLQAGQLVADLIYHPSETALLRAARDRGASTTNGLPMLLNQAALQFSRWTGQSAPLDAMRGALQHELAQR